MSPWFRQHRFALGSALSSVRRGPGSFLFNVLVVALALTLPFAGVTLLDNVRPLSEQLSVDPEISLFMKLDTPREQAAALAPQIRTAIAAGAGNNPGMARVAFVPPSDPSARGIVLSRSRDGKLSLRIGDLPRKYRNRSETWMPESSSEPAYDLLND